MIRLIRLSISICYIISYLFFLSGAAIAATKNNVSSPLDNSSQSQCIKSLRASDEKNKSRLVIDLFNKPDYKVIPADNKKSLIINIKKCNENVAAVSALNNKLNNKSHFKQIVSKKISLTNSNNIETSIDIKLGSKLISYKYFVLAGDDKIQRLVLDVIFSQPETKEPGNKAQEIGSKQPIKISNKKEFIPIPVLKKVKKPLIVIDAGHGGNDPGTKGTSGSLEKNITLEYAIELQDELLTTEKYDVLLTRKDDVYIDLKKRVAFARENNADMFISIHADSHEDTKMQGLSIYTLSETASDDEAKALALKENNSGIQENNLENDTDVSLLLTDLAHRETKNLSAELAENVIVQVKPETNILFKNPHRFAGFRVLTAPDIPSVLIELGYLSNPNEETLLLSPEHKNKLAKAITRAINAHFKKYSW